MIHSAHRTAAATIDSPRARLGIEKIEERSSGDEPLGFLSLSAQETEPDQLQSLAEGEIHGKSKGAGVHSVGVEGRENESGK